LAKKDLLAGSAPDGGFFLSNDRSSRVSMRVFETSPVRSVATVETTTADVWEVLIDDDEPASGWVGEVQDRPKTDSAQVALIKIPIHEQYAMPQATQKILDDAGFDIAGWHQRKVADKFSRLENTAFVSGDGSAKPKGFLSYSAWAAAGTYQRDAVEQVTTAASGTIAGDDLIGLQGSLIENYQPGAAWMMRRATFFNSIMTLADTAGQYLLNPLMIAQGADLQLLGKPVVLAADMPAVAANALSVCYANWREFYTVVDRLGIRILRDPLTSKPYVKFYTTKRVGGAVTNYEAGKILKIKA
jgi:HK97 family phage major capsid protein